MARICDVTGKGTRTGNTRSHSMKKNKRSFKPNLIYKWVVLDDGSKMKVKICPRIYKKVRGMI